VNWLIDMRNNGGVRRACAAMVNEWTTVALGTGGDRIQQEIDCAGKGNKAE
jgi:hypothetical protein